MNFVSQKKKPPKKPLTNKREYLTPKAFSLQECCNCKYYERKNVIKVKANIINNNSDVKCACLSKPDNAFKILEVGKDAFNLIESHQFTHKEALFY